MIWFVAMSFIFFFNRCEGQCNEIEGRAVLEIKNSIDSSAYSNWNESDCCEFNGVECGIDGRIIGIDFSGITKSKSRTWYPNVTLFTTFDCLVDLGLKDLQIGGEIQAFCELKKIEGLYWLDLSNNTLEGSIHPCFGMMKNLGRLDLSNNRLRGNIPSSLFYNKTDFDRFDVSGNQLEGVVSFSMFANVSMTYLDLSNNYHLEVETESPSWVSNFQLDYLNLANCNVNNKNNHVVPSFISSQYRLLWLDLSYNSLQGTIPCWLLYNNNLTGLFLRSNKFDAHFLGCDGNWTSSLESLDISDNHVKGPLPENFGNLFPSLHHVNMSSNALQGSIPWSLGGLQILDLSNNLFSGGIPRKLTRTETSLVYLNLSNNRLRGEMLPRDSNMTNLECLQLSGNQFEGVLSPAISRSPSLVILDVRGNNLSGNIPKWLYDHPHLVAVLLGGNRFEGHLRRRMCRMGTLQVLDISNNDISGGIPSCLDNITFWKKSISPDNTNYFTRKGRLYFLMNPISQPDPFINLGTEFMTKSVRYTFEGAPLSMMTGLDMSLNKLSGDIPSKMGELSQLRSLNLSNNLLTGLIPTSFQNLKSIESLDLSHNRLSGKVPYEMVELNFLSSFSVAYNNLSGRIPFEQQFSTFSVDCYDGNPYLCGKPVPRNCSPTNSLEPQPEEKKEGTTSIIDNSLFFYSFVAVSYAFGFWGFFGILFFNKRWRQNYFRAMDRYIQSCFDRLSEYW